MTKNNRERMIYKMNGVAEFFAVAVCVLFVAFVLAVASNAKRARDVSDLLDEVLPDKR